MLETWAGPGSVKAAVAERDRALLSLHARCDGSHIGVGLHEAPRSHPLRWKLASSDNVFSQFGTNCYCDSALARLQLTWRS